MTEALDSSESSDYSNHSVLYTIQSTKSWQGGRDSTQRTTRRELVVLVMAYWSSIFVVLGFVDVIRGLLTGPLAAPFPLEFRASSFES